MQITEKLEWGKYARPSENKQSAIHNWFVYHHSFGKTLVSEILNELKLDRKARVLDPFCGSGTTLLVCQHKGIECVGMDLMPLSILVSRAKTNHYSVVNLRNTFKKIESSLDRIDSYPKPDISIINKAFTQKAWDQIQSIREVVETRSCGKVRDFFLTGLLGVVSSFGAYSNDGGFPRLVRRPKVPLKDLQLTFMNRVNKMTNEVELCNSLHQYDGGRVPIIITHDARNTLNKLGRFDAIVTSPPYPNRHDYTRVYTAELAAAFLKNNEELKKLRARLFRSHIEAKPDDTVSLIDEIRPFIKILRALRESPKADDRVPGMLRAYYQDMEKTLSAIWKLLKPNAVAAIVVGNVRFSGVMVPVDEITALIGRNIGFISQGILVIRYRGNSPQQMRDFGKITSRESIVMLRKGA